MPEARGAGDDDGPAGLDDASRELRQTDGTLLVEYLLGSPGDIHQAEAQVLGMELWEALCWRRGALRYYMAKTAVDGRIKAAAAPAGSESE